MKPTIIVTLASASVLAACASPPVEPASTAKCDEDGFVPRTYQLQVRTDKRGAPSRVDRNLTFVDQRALAVRAGDTVEWQLRGKFWIEFPTPVPGVPPKLENRDRVQMTLVCSDFPESFCQDPKAVAGNGVCYRLYKYDVGNESGTLDPMIVVER